ncbi:unnamed protein product [Dovyalis caffra]|uniref:OTU domain-containing protein n=1 Tax=Dovyalis caffra TaxID=77055 RepID=A0AAV1SDA2_9ROSI|nr:unnamed protein product [Dovyalis caffra]
MTDAQEIQDKPTDAIPANASQKKDESRDEMLSRHRKEITQLQNKEIEMKKAAAKGSKAEQKAKKKLVEEEISQLSEKLKGKHSEELASLGYNSTNGNESSKLDSLVKAVAGVSVTNQPEHSKPSKSAKRRGKELSKKLKENKEYKKSRATFEIKPDGHCLYRAVEDQLALLSGGSTPYNYQELRKMVAAYMRENSSDFLPFFLSDTTTEENSENSLSDRFENYCKDVESTTAWGGQLELGALTHCLRRHIKVFSGSFPDVEMGKEYKSDGGACSSNASIMLSYHKHAFGLGEHYNSVVPNLAQ